MFSIRSFIYSLVFLLLGSFVIVHAEISNSASEDSVLRLSKALDQALSHNLGLTISRYEPEKQKDAVFIEAASFDVGVFANTQYRESQAASSSPAQGSFVNQSRANLGLDKRLKSGASVRIGTSATRTDTITDGLLDPVASGAISLSIRQPLLLGAGRQVNLAPLVRASAKQEQSIEILRAEIQDFITEVEIAYWNLAFSQASALLVRSNLELANSLLAENLERARLGLVTQLEVMQARTEFLKQQESSIIAGRAVQDSQDRLIALIGMDSLASNEPIQMFSVESLQPNRNSTLPDMHRVVATALQVDSDTKIQYKEIEIARLNQLLAKNLTVPKLDLTAGVDYLGSDAVLHQAYTDAYRGVDGYDWNVGFELRVPWGLRDARARYNRATRTVQQQELRLYEIRQIKARLARSAWRAVQAGTQRVEVTQTAIALNEESFEQERARYGAGLTAYRQVLEAQRDLDKARRSHLQALIDQRRATVQLARVDGTILDRNGYTWADADALLSPPTIEGHPLLDKN